MFLASTEMMGNCPSSYQSFVLMLARCERQLAWESEKYQGLRLYVECIVLSIGPISYQEYTG